MRGIKNGGARLSSVVPRDRTDNGLKLKYTKLHLNAKKILFAVRRVRHYSRLPGQVVESLSMEILKT